MCFIADHNHIRAAGDEFVAVFELLDIGEDDSVALALLKQFIEVFTIASLDRLLAQIVAAGRKGAVQLVVQVEAVGKHKQGCAEQIFQ